MALCRWTLCRLLAVPVCVERRNTTLALARYFLPPSPSALLPRPSPLVRGFFLPQHPVSSFRGLPQSATAPMPNCLDFGWRSRRLQKKRFAGEDLR